jgi:mono/diheme cytochrome c family protein
VTEIPEHLLKRSKERRSAIGGDDASADDATAAPAAAAAPAEAAPAVPAVAAAAEVEQPAPAPVPVRPEVAAAQRRRKIPYWAMPVLLGLPLWAYVYAGTLEPPPASEEGPMAIGEEIYGRCSACHGADGAGVSGPALSDVLTTFPDGRDQMAWVALGSDGWRAFADSYGANAKPVGGGMPAFAASLSEEELAAVVLYERVAFHALEEGSEDYLLLEALANGETTLEAEGLGEVSTAAGIDAAALAP